MKVLFINKNLSLGGGEKLIVNLAKEAKKNHHQFDIAIFENVIELNVEGLEIIKLSPIRKIPKFLRIFFAPYFLFKLLYITGSYDYILSFERYPAYFNVLISKILQKKSIIYLQNSPYYSFRQIYTNKFIRWFHSKLHRLIFKSSYLIICVGQGIRKEIVKDFGLDQDKVVVLPPSINPRQIDSLLKSSLIDEDKKLFEENKIIISIGRLHSQKNFSLLIKSFFNIQKKIKNARLVIIGEGEERKKIEDLIVKLRLQNKVFLLGQIPNPFPYLVKAQVFVLSSKFEGFPHVLLEALYCQVPIVSLNYPYGPKEILAPDYGLLVDTKNKGLDKTLAKHIITILENAYLRKDLIKNSRKRALDFTINKTYGKLVNILMTNETN